MISVSFQRRGDRSPDDIDSGEFINEREDTRNGQRALAGSFVRRTCHASQAKPLSSNNMRCPLHVTRPELQTIRQLSYMHTGIYK